VEHLNKNICLREDNKGVLSSICSLCTCYILRKHFYNIKGVSFVKVKPHHTDFSCTTKFTRLICSNTLNVYEISDMRFTEQ